MTPMSPLEDCAPMWMKTTMLFSNIKAIMLSLGGKKSLPNSGKRNCTNDFTSELIIESDKSIDVTRSQQKVFDDMIMFKPGFFSALQYHKIMNIVTELHLWACMQCRYHMYWYCYWVFISVKTFSLLFFFFQFLGWLLIYILFIFPNIFNVINLKHCIYYIDI